ncbi:MAG TPA: MFS transporter [Methylophilaceae bacterium]|nr:MFS transporter [Methylophilaceae bacterium]
MTSAITPFSAIHLLRNRSYVKLLAYRLLIVLSYQMMAVVVGWHIYQITRDPLALGLIGLAEVIPYFCCALFAGYAVDHHSRRLFGVMAAVILSLNALLLSAVSFGWVGSSNPSLWIYGAIACTGIARAFIAPSYNALFALILPREQFSRAAGVSSSVFQTGLVVGPALGGLIVGWASITAAYVIAAMLSLGSAIVLLLLRVKEPPPAESAPIFSSIAQGLRFVYGNQIMLGAQALDMFAVLFGGAVAMLPAFIHEIYDYGPEGLGILRAAPAIGAVMTGIVLARHPINKHAGRILLCAVAGFGLCTIAFALTRHFWMAWFILMLSGVFDGISVVLRSTIMQLVTPDNMRGRVASINGIFIGSSNELGAFEQGVAARLLGLVPALVFGGLMTLSVVGITARFAPKLRKLNLNDLH